MSRCSAACRPFPCELLLGLINAVASHATGHASNGPAWAPIPRSQPRIWIQQATQAAAIERPPFAFGQCKPVRHGVKHHWIVPQTAMAALHLDIVRGRALLLPT